MTKNYFSVKNRIVVITGGLGRLGRQMSLALLDSEAKVAIFDSSADPDTISERFKDRCSDENILFAKVNITSKSSIKKGLGMVNSIWGVPSALINNAALDSPPDSPTEENGPFETYPEESWDKIMDVNVKGTFLCCQVIGDQMAKARQGSIVNICSTYGIVSPDFRIYKYRITDGKPFYKPAAYSASKSSLLNLTRYLSVYWAPNNIRVNTITFGGVLSNQDPSFLKEYCTRVPLGRMAREDEYNGAIIFLISDASSYMTGSNLVIDGGWTAW